MGMRQPTGDRLPPAQRTTRLRSAHSSEQGTSACLGLVRKQEQTGRGLLIDDRGEKMECRDRTTAIRHPRLQDATAEARLPRLSSPCNLLPPYISNSVSQARPAESTGPPRSCPSSSFFPCLIRQSSGSSAAPATTMGHHQRKLRLTSFLRHRLSACFWSLQTAVKRDHIDLE